MRDGIQAIFQKKRILTICSNNLYKGIETVFETSITLKKSGYKNVLWEIAGLKSNDEIIELCSKKYRVSPKDIGIKLLGPLNENEIVSIMCESSIYVQTSHIENSPNSICEAMLVGIPIIASSAGGTMSLLLHEKEGIIFQNGDSIALAGGIINLLNRNTKDVMQMANNAHERALERHDRQNIKASLLQDYHQIVAQEL